MQQWRQLRKSKTIAASEYSICICSVCVVLELYMPDACERQCPCPKIYLYNMHMKPNLLVNAGWTNCVSSMYVVNMCINLMCIIYENFIFVCLKMLKTWLLLCSQLVSNPCWYTYFACDFRSLYIDKFKTGIMCIYFVLLYTNLSTYLFD